MNKKFFVRDTGFLLAGLLALLYAIVIRRCIDLPMSFFFIGLYVAYVVVVFQQDRAHSKEANSEEARKKALARDMTELNNLQVFGDRPVGVDRSKVQMSYDFET